MYSKFTEKFQVVDNDDNLNMNNLNKDNYFNKIPSQMD